MQNPATLVEGKYEVLAKIREGGMGTIYKVRHRLLDEVRVIKVMRPNVAADEEFRRRFIDEAKTATRLRHPNICAIYDFALDPDGSSSLVMEYIDGVTLADLLQARGSLDVALALEITHQTLLALGYLHRKKIVHRDIAPDNLMLTVDDDGKSVVKLIDLGIAKVLDRGGGEMTSTGQFLGKLRYASPEQYGSLPRGMTIDGRSDLYSMGLVLYELLTGRRPFTGETPIELMRAHVYSPPLPFEESDPRGLVPGDIREVVLKALRKSRDERFATAQEFDRAVVANLAQLDRRAAEEEGPTLILGIKSQARTEEPFQTPSAQDRLDFQFAAQKTPTAGPTTPMRSAPLVDAVAEARIRQEKELQEVREREAVRDVAGLERLLESESLSPAAAEELRAAIERLRRLEQEEEREKEDLAWRRASAEGSNAAWDRYLAENRDSPRREEAARRRDEAKDFRQAAAQETHAAWTSFLAKWAEGPHRDEALVGIQAVKTRDEAALNDAMTAGSADAYRAFLAAHSGSALAESATSMLEEETDFDGVASQDTEGAWRGFLERWPSGLRSATASQQLKAALQREERAWNEASEDGTAGGLLKFLNVFPSGKHHHEAEGMLRELAELDAAGKEGKEGYQKFLRKYPTSRHARAARHRIHELEEKALLAQVQQYEAALQEPELEKVLLTHPPGSSAIGTAAAEALVRVRAERERRKLEVEETEWALATSAGREEDWKRFLKKHPYSRHADEARRGLALAIEAKMRAAEEQAALERVRQLEGSGAEGELSAILGKEPKESPLAKSATAALERIRAQRERAKREAEEAAWAEAAAGGVEEWQGFLDAHPDSPHAAEARRKLGKAAEARRREEEEAALLAQIREHETALAEGALDRLARAQPESAAAVKSAASAALARVREGLARREREAEEQDWVRAVGEESAESWKRFLDLHPASERAKPARQRLAKAQKVESAQAKAAERAEAKAKSAARRITLVEERSRTSRRGLLIGLGAAAAVITAGILLWPTSRRTPPRPAESTAVQQVPVAAAPRVEPPRLEPTAPPPAAVVEPGELAFNAVPWGRVDRIVDASGKRWDDGLPQYTPVSLRLPPGRYTLTVSNPDYPAGLAATVEVRSGQVSIETGRFEAMDAKAYFRSQGWGG